ncbi:hypothetical protein ACFLUG_04390 [Chloroflexota bacterium]
MPELQCPICENPLNRPPSLREDMDASRYDCPQCGNFTFSDYTRFVQGFEDSKPLISAWIRRQNTNGTTPIVAQGDNDGTWFRTLRSMGFPQTVNEKLDGLLLGYANVAKDDYAKIIKSGQYLALISEIAGKNYGEIKGINQLLVELEYLASTSPANLNEHMRITAKGWQRIADLQQPSSSSDLVFIAMWFDPSLDGYRESVKAAVTECGFEPIFIDAVEFNGFIMDEVIKFIRQARFMIADLTCSPENDDMQNRYVTGGVRGGVYWEAGMAYGLSKSVIQTCKDEDFSKRRVHFDLNQYQTMSWKQDELSTDIRPLSGHIPDPTFTERLAIRISSTVGKGNYIPPS